MAEYYRNCIKLIIPENNSTFGFEKEFCLIDEEDRIYLFKTDKELGLGNLNQFLDGIKSND